MELGQRDRAKDSEPRRRMLMARLPFVEPEEGDAEVQAFSAELADR